MKSGDKIIASIITLIVIFFLFYGVQLFAQQQIRNGMYIGDSTNTGIHPSVDSDSLYIVVNGDTTIMYGGTYETNSTINLSSYSVINGNGATFKVSGVSSSFYLFSSDTLVNDILIENIIFDGNSPTEDSTTAIYLDSVTNLTISNCTFKNFDTTTVNIGASGIAKNIVIENCIFEDNDAINLMFDEQRNVSILDCKFYDCAKTAIDLNFPAALDSINSVIISGCYIEDAGMGDNESAISLAGSNVRCVNNHIDGGGLGITVHGSETATFNKYLIANNQIDNCYKGINAAATQNRIININNNQVRYFDLHGISVSGDSDVYDGLISVSNNTIEDSVTSAFAFAAMRGSIRVAAISNVNVNDNKIYYPEFAGILLENNVRNISIDNNLIVRHRGIALSDSTNYLGAGIACIDANDTFDGYGIAITNNKIYSYHQDKVLIGNELIFSGGIYVENYEECFINSNFLTSSINSISIANGSRGIMVNGCDTLAITNNYNRLFTDDDITVQGTPDSVINQHNLEF